MFLNNRIDFDTYRSLIFHNRYLEVYQTLRSYVLGAGLKTFEAPLWGLPSKTANQKVMSFLTENINNASTLLCPAGFP